MSILIIVSHNGGNGLSKYEYDLIEKKHNFFSQVITNESRTKKLSNVQIVSNNEMLDILENIDFYSIVHLNILPNYKTVNIDNYVSKLISNKYVKLYVTIHDIYWFNQKEPNSNVIIKTDICNKLLQNSFLVIFPTKSCLAIYDKHVDLSKVNYIVESHMDINYNLNSTQLYYPVIKDIIKIVFVGDYDEHKGSKLFDELINLCYYDNSIIEYHIIGRCDKIFLPDNVIAHGRFTDDNIFDIINNIQPTIMVNLSLYDETWSYILSINLKTGLPILYTDISLYNERIINRPNTMKIMNDDNIIDKVNDFIKIIKQNDNKEFIKINDNNIYFTPFYENLYDIFNSSIKPFAIYFPQHHEVEENNIYFYKNMTDMKNLYDLKNDLTIDTNQILTPLEFYDQNDIDVISKQIGLAKQYDIFGFAIYHYWFSNNGLFPDRSKVMYKVIEKIFSQEYDNFEFYFIWANEDWKQYNGLIKNGDLPILTNDYSNYPFLEHFNYLLTFFKHKNYTKIDLKPVFMIHHIYKFTPIFLDTFYEKLNMFLMDNGFNGVYLCVNDMLGNNNKYTSYHMHCNYMDNIKPVYSSSLCNIFDYETYIKEKIIDNDLNKGILSVFTGFDNRARLYGNNNNVSKTIFIHCTPDNFKTFLEKQFNNYKKVENKTKIFMINAWNEWGENMVLEPCIEYGNKYLETFKEVLNKHF